MQCASVAVPDREALGNAAFVTSVVFVVWRSSVVVPDREVWDTVVSAAYPFADL